MALSLRSKRAAVVVMAVLGGALWAPAAQAQAIGPLGGGVSRTLIEATGWTCSNVVGHPGLAVCTNPGHGGYSCSYDQCYPNGTALSRPPYEMPIVNVGGSRAVY